MYINFNPSHISNLKDKITTLSMTRISLNHWRHTTQLFNKSFFPELDRIRLWIENDFIQTYNAHSTKLTYQIYIPMYTYFRSYFM